MRLRILLPTRVLLDESVEKLSGESAHGSFTILPRHIDFVTHLVPGIFSYVPEGSGSETYLALDEGILVKVGDQLLASVRRGVRGDRLGNLRRAVEEEFLSLSEREKKTRSVLSRLEADFAKRFLGMSERG